MPGATVASVTCSMAGQAGEGMHDAPHRAKQTHIGRDRTHRSQEGQTGLDHVHLTLETGAHGAARAVHQGASVADAALTQLLVFAHAAGKNALHRAGQLGVLGGCGKQVIQAGARPEFALELFVERVHPFEGKQLAEDGRPAGDETRTSKSITNCTTKLALQHQVQDGQVLVH
jgi:hypothetical protein